MEEGELLTLHQEEKRKRHTSNRTIQILLGPQVTKKHMDDELVDLSLRQTMIHRVLLVAGFFVEMLPQH